MILRAAAALLLIAAPGPAAAATATASQRVVVVIGPAAGLSVNAPAVTFPVVDPEVEEGVPALSPVPIRARVRTAPGGTAVLTVIASGDLTSGTDSIDVGSLSWEASGPGFIKGAMSHTSAQTVGMWTGSGERAGSLFYRFRGGYRLAPGTYTTSVTYTLTAP